MELGRLRREAGLTQMQLAQALGVKQPSVSLWEKKGTMPRADKLPKLAKLLNCSIDKLMTA